MSLSVNYILHVLLEKGGGAFHLFENKIRFIVMNHQLHVHVSISYSLGSYFLCKICFHCLCFMFFRIKESFLFSKETVQGFNLILFHIFQVENNHICFKYLFRNKNIVKKCEQTYKQKGNCIKYFNQYGCQQITIWQPLHVCHLSE